jgi:NADH dehydrogenase FAD-containing subunit
MVVRRQPEIVVRRHLVLAGAGHAHLDLLAAMLRRPLPDWDATLITAHPVFCYSGLLPSIMAGATDAAAAQVPVSAIARAAGMHVREASVVALNAGAQTVTLSNGEIIAFDLLSLDVGSAAHGLASVPGATEHAYPMRPFLRALDLLTVIDARVETTAMRAPVPVVVVGAGAAGAEISLALRARIANAGRMPRITLVDATAADGLPLAGFAQRARIVTARALKRRGITLLYGRATEVRADAVLVECATETVTLASVATAWISGAAAHAWLATSGLQCDARGYPLAHATLALTDQQTIFGGGDCVTLRGAPETPKAGVYAVRMAPVLARNVISAAYSGHASARFTPQRDFLALLSTGDGEAILRWRGVALESTWAQLLKTWIDSRYLARYRALAGAPPTELYRPASIPPPSEIP